jgi:hypothetical protein
MHKSLIMLVGVAGIGSAAVVAPSPAQADCIGRAVGAGILAGAAIGSVITTDPLSEAPDIGPMVTSWVPQLIHSLDSAGLALKA